MDPLRNDIKRLMREVPEILIENDDMTDLLDGRVDKVIENHKSENLTIASISDDEPIDAGRVILSPREDMADDGEIDNQEITKVLAQAMIYQFNINYDVQTVKNLEQTRNSKQTKKTSRRLQEYDKQREQVTYLKKKYDL